MLRNSVLFVKIGLKYLKVVDFILNIKIPFWIKKKDH